jgi:hypothetical protein
MVEVTIHNNMTVIGQSGLKNKVTVYAKNNISIPDTFPFTILSGSMLSTNQFAVGTELDIYYIDRDVENGSKLGTIKVTNDGPKTWEITENCELKVM